MYTAKHRKRVFPNMLPQNVNTHTVHIPMVTSSNKYRQCTYERNIEARSCNHRCSEKSVSITYSEWVLLALFIQHPMHMLSIILSSVTCTVLPYFSTLSHKMHDLRGKSLIQLCFLYNFCLKHSSFLHELSEILPYTYIGLHVKCPLFLSDFN